MSILINISKTKIVYLLVFFVLLTVDQLSKLLAITYSAVSLNSGISFGLGSSYSTVVVVVFIASIVLMSAQLLSEFWEKHPHITLLFFSGSISNLLDRLFRGSVVDWIDITFLGLRNNLADMYIGLAVFLFMCTVLLKGLRNEHSV